ncbi:N-acetylmuramic acid 6-phosphate etherase [Belliella kenyensis]|uniref:N-acetylmuramic acid 6-phosphate etherase n=1 Tax=Belliella kenyensis TaxID=1472724 RepID=A0ABV8EGN4_9BACT|nr:N-acetylmuramic acid 6-phosphate etherase [Belliella kenyensis]MCH7402339.1 N-acetylmuramic acid 6-phosphate etherase [Belliella kenyensis]MDN3603531.1 N-acetylmuramic acid 6-phosphate etherase [Belliella kenyensis]
MSTTESNSLYDHLELADTRTILRNINQEDAKVALAVEKVLPQIEYLVEEIVPRMQNGGRLFYIGAGTSGRLGILDASECPPTFGVSHDLVVGIIAGGDKAIRKAVENAEDDANQAWIDIQSFGFNEQDTVIGIAASGTTPYVLGGVKAAREEGLLTGCITCNANSPLASEVKIAIEVVVGPEFITGSTRMKAGTAQKLVLNMISTTVMIKLGRIKGNKMVDMQLSNEKLIKRGVRMIMEATDLQEAEAKEYLLKLGSVRSAVEAFYQK